MAEKNFMTAGTEIDAYKEKMNQCSEKISNILTEACVSRAKNGKVSNALGEDISKLISSLPLETQVQILTKLAVNLSGQIKGGNTNTSTKKSSARINDIFANRDFY